MLTHDMFDDSHAHTLACTITNCPTLPHSLTFSPSLSHVQIHTHSHTNSLPLPPTLPHSHTLTHSLTHSLTHPGRSDDGRIPLGQEEVVGVHQSHADEGVAIALLHELELLTHTHTHARL
jgi:hypothetical protein